jgi:hypothetical protein
MLRFLTFLGEAFPPPKSKPSGPAKPKVGAKPTFGKAKSEDAGGPDKPKTAAGDAEQGMSDGTDALVAMQQAQQEKEEQEAAAQAAAEQAKQAEHEKRKAIRAKADNEVADALVDKFNTNDDTVEFWPELQTFGQFTSDGRMDKGTTGAPGAVGNGPDDETRKKDDENAHEDEKPTERGEKDKKPVNKKAAKQTEAKKPKKKPGE